MPALKDFAALALAARLLERPLNSRASRDQTDTDATPQAGLDLAPLLDQYLTALEEASLPELVQPADPAAVLEDLANRLALAEKNTAEAFLCLTENEG